MSEVSAAGERVERRSAYRKVSLNPLWLAPQPSVRPAADGRAFAGKSLIAVKLSQAARKAEHQLDSLEFVEPLLRDVFEQ